MSFIDLVWKCTWRRPLRTVLFMVCVAIAFLIHGLSASYRHGSQGTAAASEDLMGVMHAAGRSQTLPLAYLNRIAALPGVAAVAPITRMRGFVTVEKNAVAVSAADPKQLMAVNGKELGLTPPLLDALAQGRDRVLVGRALATAQAWSVGDRIAYTAQDVVQQDGARIWRFEIAGIFEGASASSDTYFVLARYDYVNAARGRGKDSVNTFAVRPDSATLPAVLAARLDALFANSGAPTRTQSEKQFLDAFLRQYADIGRVLDLVVGAAFVTLLMIIINTMVFAVRERRFEIGVLKTLGFSGSRIVLLILAETLLVFAVGGGIGTALAKLASAVAGPTLGLVFSSGVLIEALVLLLALAAATGLLPAWRALSIPVSTAFRTR